MGYTMEELTKMVESLNDVILTFPPFEYCTDNAAMIGVAAYFQELKK